ncbi:Triosephosphate isomerase [Roseovarius sp. EC-HK134]|uniref:triose-phosphate isomerase n=1 Tax=unclassified Roseovarius TaxID=2614913 RepID=UPI0012526254|nr:MULTISPECIES: triose-phosphate isomerase [unclassified Roseovarius]VVT29294.1 Triosephosphate isomerase [Roseovarius sp. EC-HK134]VVT30448.1 Triosephosphate isomerase [Roseovarius sp. EC-SD190]
MRRKLAAGNWKMNGINASLTELQALIAAHPTPQVDILICPPATLIVQAAGLSADSPLMIGAQDCHAAASGAHTGDVSAPMLADAGAVAVILGHSERRQDHAESSALVAAKATAAHAAHLTALICVGESLAEREAAQTLDVIAEHLRHSLPDSATAANTVIAYEPIWAIGTGLTPSPAQISEVHRFLRAELTARFGAEAAQGIRLLYGGSVKPANAPEIFALADVDGALVGGASLTTAEFSPIITALEQA